MKSRGFPACEIHKNPSSIPGNQDIRIFYSYVFTLYLFNTCIKNIQSNCNENKRECEKELYFWSTPADKKQKELNGLDFIGDGLLSPAIKK